MSSSKVVSGKKILIMRFSAMGDVAMTRPIVEALAKRHKESEISILSRPFAHAIYERTATNIKVISIDPKREYKGLWGLFKLFLILRKKEFDTVIDLHDVLRTKIIRWLFALCGKRVTHINKHRKEKRLLVRRKNKIKKTLPSVFELYQAAVNKAIQENFSIDDIRDTVTPNIKQNKKTIIGIAPFAAHKQKMYPIDKIEEVIKLITKNHPEIEIYLFGKGKDEETVINNFISKYKNCKASYNEFSSLSEEIKFMSSLRLMVSMDSANMHLASLASIPVISIWGPTHPWAGFLGWGQSLDNTIGVDYLNCRPCSIFGNKPCYRGDMACMQEIEPKIVYDKVMEELEVKA